jgi:hypothetical protein
MAVSAGSVPLVGQAPQLVQEAGVPTHEPVQLCRSGSDQPAVGLGDDVPLLRPVEHARRLAEEIARSEDGDRDRTRGRSTTMLTSPLSIEEMVSPGSPW